MRILMQKTEKGQLNPTVQVSTFDKGVVYDVPDPLGEAFLAQGAAIRVGVDNQPVVTGAGDLAPRSGARTATRRTSGTDTGTPPASPARDSADDTPEE